MNFWQNTYLLMQDKQYHKAEYVQCCVSFVNEQVPWPHSNINAKFCTSRLCMKMSPFLVVCAWAMPRILYLSCGVPFTVWTPGNISGLISEVLCLLRWEVTKKNSGSSLWSLGGKLFFWGRLRFCPALTKLALALHVNFCLFVCLFVCLSFRSFFQCV